MEIKRLLEELETAEQKTAGFDDALENDPENEELEKAWDNAYEDEFKAFNALVDGIVLMSCGKIERKTAINMVVSHREKLQAIISKAA